MAGNRYIRPADLVPGRFYVVDFLEKQTGYGGHGWQIVANLEDGAKISIVSGKHLEKATDGFWRDILAYKQSIAEENNYFVMRLPSKTTPNKIVFNKKRALEDMLASYEAPVEEEEEAADEQPGSSNAQPVGVVKKRRSDE